MADAVDRLVVAACNATVDHLATLLESHLPTPPDGATAAIVADIQNLGKDRAKQRACGSLGGRTVILDTRQPTIVFDALPGVAAADVAPMMTAPAPPPPMVGNGRPANVPPSGVDLAEAKRQAAEAGERSGSGGSGLALLALLYLATRGS